MLDPQRFLRGTVVSGPDQVAPVMVRRLKSDLTALGTTGFSPTAFGPDRPPARRSGVAGPTHSGRRTRRPTGARGGGRGGDRAGASCCRSTRRWRAPPRAVGAWCSSTSRNGCSRAWRPSLVRSRSTRSVWAPPACRPMRFSSLRTSMARGRWGSRPRRRIRVWSSRWRRHRRG
jgi:hypothetical protein